MSQSLPPWQVSQEQQPAATERMGIRAKAWGRAGSLLGKATALSGQHTRLDSLTNGLSRAHGFVTSPQQQSFYPGTRSIDSSAPASRIRTFISGAKATRDLNTKTEERCIAFPGYACIRSTPGIPQVEVEVSGFAFRTRPLEHASRTQKVFVKMAQQLSGVKKPSKLASSPRSSLEDSSPPSSAASSVTSFNSGASDVHPSAQDQVWNDLFALSNQNAPDDDVRKALKDLHLTDEPQLLYTPENSPPITPRGSISDLSSVASANQVATPRPGGPQRSSTDNLKHSPLRKPVELPGRTGVSGAVEAANSAFSNLDLNTDEAQMHTNMKERLRAFFSQKLDQRRVRITVYLDEQGKDEKELRCLAKGTVVTAPGGGFKQVVAFPAVLKEDGRCLEGAWLRVTSELLPFADDATGSEAPGRFDCCYAQVVSHDIPRIISDIDDTVKISEVTGGVRRVFRNVFSMPYERVIVQGMSQWYGQMAQKGAALHYVSNGPWELTEVVRRFLEAAGLPHGQLKLKEYVGGSFINSMWESAANRKRQNVVSVLDNFPDSKFILVGDSGEQDLELYTEIAQVYPDRILGIFIRDVSTSGTPSSAKSNGSPARMAEGTPMPDAHADLLSPNNPLSQTDYTERRVSTSLWRRLIEAQNALPDGCLMRTFKVGDEVAEDATILVDQVMKERSARCQKSSSAAERVSLDSGSVSLYDPPVAQSEKKRPPPPLPPRPRPTLDQVGMESESSETIKPPPIPPRTAKAS